MATTKNKRRQIVADDYFTLINRFPLRPIRTAADLKAAHAMIDELSVIGEEKLTAGQTDYLLVLGDLATAYEADAMNEMLASLTGLDVLRHLMEEHGMSASDVGRVIGQRELGVKVVKGDRQITRDHAKALGEHFGLPAETFLR